MLKILNNKIITFIVSRYLSYFIQFLNSLVAAYVLGPFYLGIWGFLALILMYLNFGNFGIDIALNVKLSTGNLAETEKQSQIASNAVAATLLTSSFFLVVGIVLYYTGVTFFEKYMFSQYMFVVILISCLNYFNVVFLNICRTYSVFAPISFFQTVVQLLQLPMFFIFKDVELVWALLSMMVLAHILSLIFFVWKLPVKLSFKLDFTGIKDLFLRGISLLSYALTFYILLLSTRSVVGYIYPVETMGLFTFAVNIASALIVGLSSLEFVLFPKMLNRLSEDKLSESSVKSFNEVRFIYMTTAFFVVILGLLAFPVMLFYFEAYSSTKQVFTFLVMCQIVISGGFGYSTLIISRGKELYLVRHGLVALLINMLCAFLFARFFEFSYSYLSVFLLFSLVYYELKVIKKGRELMGMSTAIGKRIVDLIPVRSLLPLLFIAAAGFTEYYFTFTILSLLAFIALHLKKLAVIKKYVLTLLHKPSVINI